MLDLLDDVVKRRWDHPFPRTGCSLFCRRDSMTIRPHGATTWKTLERSRIRCTMNFFGQYFAYLAPVLLLAAGAWYLAVLWMLWRIARALERRPL